MLRRDVATGLWLPGQTIGIWPLDESAGLVAEESSGSSLMQATYAASGMTYRQFGMSPALPHAVETDGVAGKVTLPTLTGLGSTVPQTWEMCNYRGTTVDSTTSGFSAFSSNSSGTTPFAFGSNTGLLTNEVVMMANDNVGANTRTGWTSFTIPAGWNHHLVTYNGTQNGWTYYLNGVATGTKVSNASGCSGFASSVTFTLGISFGSFFAVRVGMVGVHLGFIDAAEAARRYQVLLQGSAMPKRNGR